MYKKKFSVDLTVFRLDQIHDADANMTNGLRAL